MKMNDEGNKKRKGKGKMVGWIITIIILAAIGIGGAIGWTKLSNEHKEAKNLTLNGVNFAS